MKTPVKKTLFFFIFSMSLIVSNKTRAQIIDSSIVNGVIYKTFHSDILDENRKISIQIPKGMKPYEKYPVLYLLDGEVFTEMAGGQVNYLSGPYKIIPQLIIVGIENTDRTRDLTPTHSIIGPDGKPDTSARAMGKTSGGGEKFLTFIDKELKTYVDAQYPTAPYNILMGHSLGGLMAAYCLINHPEYFNAYIAISPSLQWDNQIMLKQVAERSAKQFPIARTLFFSDANEDTAFHQNQLSLDSLLKQKNIPGLSYKRFFYPGETHLSEPVKAFYDGIRLIYPDWYLPYNSSAFKKIMNSRMIIDHYNELSKKYGYKVIPPHDEIIQISRFLRNDPARIKDAIEVLQMNMLNYPASATTAETLGDTYMKAGNKDEALKSFQKALSLDPKREGLEQKIKQLQ